MDEELLYKIALTLIPGVGCVNAKTLVAYCGGVQAVFREKKRALLKVPGIGGQTVDAISNSQVFDRAQAEMDFIEKNDIEALFYLDKEYPTRLTYCHDSPVLLYYKGNALLNAEKIVGIVGTRNATQYGRDMCDKLVDGLAAQNVLVISGLAYGIDTWAHKAALDNQLQTIGVLGHGLDKIYPFQNRALAQRMQQSGGILTEFMSNTRPDRENFPKRNRIIAGLCDAIIVVEAAESGGALITADLANQYNRDVFSVPGRVGDIYSEGCNKLIKTNKAALIQSAEDILYMMNWQQKDQKAKSPQRELFIQLSPDEEIIVNMLKQKGDTAIDTLLAETGLLPAKAASLLLNLEFQGVLRCLPGKVYKLL